MLEKQKISFAEKDKLEKMSSRKEIQFHVDVGVRHFHLLHAEVDACGVL